MALDIIGLIKRLLKRELFEPPGCYHDQDELECWINRLILRNYHDPTYQEIVWVG